MAGTELNFDLNRLKAKSPGRYQVFTRLLDGMKAANAVDAPDYTAPEFLDADGNPDMAMIQAHMAAQAENQMANAAYMLSEFMSANMAYYGMTVDPASVTMKHTSKSVRVFTPSSIRINVKRYCGDDEQEASADGMMEDGYAVVVVSGGIERDLTASVSLGCAVFDLGVLGEVPEAVKVQLRRLRADGHEVEDEVSVVVVKVPYVGDDGAGGTVVVDEDGNPIDIGGDGGTPPLEVRLEYDDNFMAYGETKHIRCRVFRGWTEVTDRVERWSVTRATGDLGSDMVWGGRDKARLFHGEIDLEWNAAVDDIGGGEKAVFEFSAFMGDGTMVSDTITI